LPAVIAMIDDLNHDLFMLQEHWSTPINLDLFDKKFVNYFNFGYSDM
jgi:hypothetical protein